MWISVTWCLSMRAMARRGNSETGTALPPERAGSAQPGGAAGGEIADGAYTRYQAYATHMQLSQPWSLKRNMVLMYGAESLSWEDQNSTTQVVMRAERGRRSSDFNLCTEVGVNDFSRVSCTQWRVPQNWKAGQALTYLGQRVTERHQKNVTDRYGNS